MLSLLQLAEALHAKPVLPRRGAAEVSIHRVAGASDANESSIVFAETADTLGAAIHSGAAAVLTTAELGASLDVPAKPLLLTPEPRWAFAQAARLLQPEPRHLGIDATAIVPKNVKLGDAVSIGPYAVLGEGVHVGARTRIGAGCVLADGVVIGSDCTLFPRVVLYGGVTLGDHVAIHAGAVLGSDGFGYVRNAETGAYLQFPQQGTLVIENDVEIGANTTVDRGALEETRIAEGTKLDNLVHIGHNVRIGRNVVIAAQTGISGSSVVADGAVLGGQVGIGEHAEVGEGVILGGGAGVLSHKKLHGRGLVFWGRPAQPLRAYLKGLATLAQLSRKGKE